MPKNAPKMAFLACFGISKRRDRCYASFGTFWDPKNLVLMPKNAKKLICIFCLFVRAEMTSRHKNSSKTLQNTPKMVQNSINGLNIYIGSPSKKKKRKILTQGKSCFFTVNATNMISFHSIRAKWIILKSWKDSFYISRVMSKDQDNPTVVNSLSLSHVRAFFR